jgi:putative membrane protein
MTSTTPHPTFELGLPARSASRRRALRWVTLVVAATVPFALTGLALAAIGSDSAALQRIPAAVVNSDTLIMSTDAEGNEQPIFAGRQLVTELTDPDAEGFSWSVTSAEKAADALARGDVFAVLTIPSTFSESLLTVGTPDAVQAQLQIDTDDAHSYLAGAIVQVVGSGLAQQFGAVVTEQYIEGLTAGIGQLGSALQQAADGATQLGDGATQLGGGLLALSDGTSASAAGASGLSGGVRDYTNGVGSLASGLGELSAGAAQLDALQPAAGGLVGQAGALAGSLGALSAAVSNSNLPPADKAAFEAALGSAQILAGTADAVIPPLNGGLDGVQSGIAQSAGGAATLAAGGAGLRDGASSLASGLQSLAAGLVPTVDAAGSLASGANELADGLASGAAEIPAAGDSAVATEPVVVDATRANAVDGVGSVIAETLVPVGLWLGALATFIALGAARRGIVASSASPGAIVRRTLGLASVVALAQSTLVTLLVHAVGGVDWMLLPGTLALTAVIALAFTTVHAALTVALGRAGLLISLLLIAVQLVAMGGIVPVAALAAPFPALSAVLPLTFAVDGMQAHFAGGDPARIAAMVGVMVLLTVGSLLVALGAAGRARRRAVLSSFAPAMVGATA